ncbi:hypothetical protein HG535_0C04950 [Zygotorulaspora mrakii]|uniref:Nucleoporin Nup82 n=1 Tax=Zygotorulaspora mrakii TaxID=42260 RepID=A0A7H9B0J6_ZYGMR|nr:uncharacterized protein HG535_0C04950 [Zygotorulaspora mrakii]QLG72141.1 hypothetical protein HG535_0C04950 [Zygotorulaspora mrakii]
MSLEGHSIFSGNILNQSNSERFFLTANRGSLCVLYQESILRWCLVSEDSYRFMQLKPAIESVKGAVLSKSGNFICLYSEVEIRIVEIPWSYTDPSSMASVFQRYRYINKKEEYGLKQVLFHGLAAQDNTIIVLRSDDSISLLNWQRDNDTIVLNRHYRALGLDAVVSDVSSITLSEDCLTLYAVNTSEGGDIYAFYPCLPSKLNISKKDLKFLLNKSLVQYEGLNVNSKADNKTNTIKQLHFVSAMQKNSATVGNEKEDLLIEVPEGRRQTRDQGPFTISPFPNKLYDCTFHEISTLPISKELDLLVLTMDNGYVAILYNDLEITMNWEFTNYDHNNSFVLVEIIKLDKPGKLSIPAGQYGKFAVSTDTGAYLIDTAKWSEKMATCLVDSDLQLIGEITFKSDIKFIDSLSHITSISFCSMLETDSLIFVSNQSVAVTPLEPNILKLPKSNHNQKTDSSNAYKIHFTQPIDEIMALNQIFQQDIKKSPSVVVDPKTRQQPLENDTNEIQLTALTEVSKDLMTGISRGQALGLVLHNRLREQQYELTCQLKMGNEILEKQDVIADTYERQLSSKKKISVKQNSLIERLNGMKKRITEIERSSSYQNSKISKKEMEWFKEIRNQVLNFNQYVHTQRKLQEQLQYVSKELKLQPNEVTLEQPLDDWDELRKVLDEDTKILKECNAQIRQASTEIHNNTVNT